MSFWKKAVQPSWRIRRSPARFISSMFRPLRTSDSITRSFALFSNSASCSSAFSRTSYLNCSAASHKEIKITKRISYNCPKIYHLQLNSEETKWHRTHETYQEKVLRWLPFSEAIMFSMHCSCSSMYWLERTSHVFLRSAEDILAILVSDWGWSDFGAVTMAISAKMADESRTVQVRSKSENNISRSSVKLGSLIKGAVISWASGWALKNSISSLMAWW